MRQGLKHEEKEERENVHDELTTMKEGIKSIQIRGICAVSSAAPGLAWALAFFCQAASAGIELEGSLGTKENRCPRVGDGVSLVSMMTCRVLTKEAKRLSRLGSLARTKSSVEENHGRSVVRKRHKQNENV